MPRSTRYRGRRGLTRALSAAGVIILVVFVLTGTAYLFLQPYFSLTEDGLLISLPFWNGSLFTRTTPEPTAEPTPKGDIVIVIDDPSPDVISVAVTPEPDSEPEPVPDTMRAVFLPQSAMTPEKTAGIAALCDAGLLDTVVFEIKAESGETAAGSQALSDALDALEGKAELVGYISVLLDNTATRNHADFAIKHTSGVNWLDADRSRWINPFVPAARDWVTAQVKTVSELPLDALLFDNLSFPVNGRQNLIAWGDNDPEQRTAVISELAGLLKDETGMPCWAVLQTDVCTGQQPGADNASQDRAVFESLFSRLFVKLPDQDAGEVYDGVLEYFDGDAPLPIIRIPAPDSAEEGASPGEVARIALGSFESYVAVSAAGEYPPDMFNP